MSPTRLQFRRRVGQTASQPKENSNRGVESGEPRFKRSRVDSANTSRIERTTIQPKAPSRAKSGAGRTKIQQKELSTEVEAQPTRKRIQNRMNKQHGSKSHNFSGRIEHQRAKTLCNRTQLSFIELCFNPPTHSGDSWAQFTLAKEGTPKG